MAKQIAIKLNINSSDGLSVKFYKTKNNASTNIEY